MQDMPPRRMLNTKATAAYCDLGESTLERLRRGSAGPCFHLIGRRVVYDVNDLDRWLATFRKTAPASGSTP